MQCPKCHFENLGLIEMEGNNYRLSIEHFTKSISIMKSRDIFSSFRKLVEVGSVLARVLDHYKDVDIDKLHQYVNDKKSKVLEGSMYFLISKILANMDSRYMSQATECIKRAIDSHQKFNLIWHLGSDYAWYAELFKKRNDISNAKHNLEKAIHISKKCGADGWAEKYEKEIATL